MDIEDIVSLSISGLALAFSVYVFFVERRHKKKYDERLALLEIDEKEKSLEEEKKAFITCKTLPPVPGKFPKFEVMNIGRHAAAYLTLQMPDGFEIIRGPFPFPQLDPGQPPIEVTYSNGWRGRETVPLIFEYEDGRGKQKQVVHLQI